MKGNAPERLVSGSDDFTMFLWEPAVSKHPKTRMTGHQQVNFFVVISSSWNSMYYTVIVAFSLSSCSLSTAFVDHNSQFFC